MNEIIYKQAKKEEKYFLVIRNLNRMARTEQLKEVLTLEDFEIFKKRAKVEDIDDYYLKLATNIIAQGDPKAYLSRNIKMYFFDPTTEEDFFHSDVKIFIAYDKPKKKTIGYSSWTIAKQFNEHCFAQQVFVLPEYRRKGIATELLKINLPNITAILADTPNKQGRGIYQKSFDADKVIYGRIDVNRNSLWIPDNGKEFVKQIKAFDPNPEEIFNKTPEKMMSRLDNKSMSILQELFQNYPLRKNK